MFGVFTLISNIAAGYGDSGIWIDTLFFGVQHNSYHWCINNKLTAQNKWADLHDLGPCFWAGRSMMLAGKLHNADL